MGFHWSLGLCVQVGRRCIIVGRKKVSCVMFNVGFLSMMWSASKYLKRFESGAESIIVVDDTNCSLVGFFLVVCDEMFVYVSFLEMT